ncbi:hypothetical protein [Streptomyces sp. NPDC058305]|uniref:P-type ATPase n=1 Tax=Streptomyces sp. NPDC058305 TaxID=3346438 RepID=UPI0036EFFBE1
MQAENAVEALAAFLPPTAHVVRDNVRCDIAAKDLVPGDILIVSEGDRVCADARIVEGTLTLDLSSLTGGRACMHTELGRIAALSQRVHTERSPLEKQVRRATRIIAVVIGAASRPSESPPGWGGARPAAWPTPGRRSMSPQCRAARLVSRASVRHIRTLVPSMAAGCSSRYRR